MDLIDIRKSQWSAHLLHDLKQAKWGKFPFKILKGLQINYLITY